MKYRRILAAISAFSLILTVCSCGKDENIESGAENTSVTEDVTESENESKSIEKGTKTAVDKKTTTKAATSEKTTKAGEKKADVTTSEKKSGTSSTTTAVSNGNSSDNNNNNNNRTAPRVGIDYAGDYWKKIEWRFIADGE